MAEASDPAALIQRLERRLERERSARLQSEAIAEQGLAELYRRQQELQLLEVIATESNQQTSIEGALSLALREVSKFIGWPLAHAYVRDHGEQDRLVSRGIWYAEDPAAWPWFRAATATTLLGAGEGLPGIALQTRQPAWIGDLASDARFVRRAIATGEGLRAAFAFPVLVGSEVAAVLEFFSNRAEEPQEHVLRIMRQIGTQLGRVIERSRAQDSLLASNLELTRLVAEAERQRVAAEAASKAKTEFLAVTSHEIRTPLNAVLGLAEALKRERLTENQSDLVQGVLDAGAMLLRLLNAVLDMSKIEAGKMSANVAPFDLRRMAEVVLSVWRPKAAEQGVTLVLDTQLPDGCCGLMADEGKLEQTLVNLIANAVKFSPPGAAVRVRLAVEDCEDHWTVRLEVQDEGPGVREEDRERIFRPFEQGDDGRELGGTGLGLAICAGNASLLGGRLGVEAPDIGGALFWLTFAAPKAEVAAHTGALAVPETTGSTLRILAAEDHPANRRVLQALLGPTGVELTLVEDGAAAVSAAQARPFDLILMDVNMPVMDGVAAVQAIRAMRGGPRRDLIYMLTANAFEEDVQRYIDAGADGVMKKPINVGELFAVLEVAALAAERAKAA